MAILVHSGPNPATAWADALRTIMPDEDIRLIDQLGDPADIEALLVIRLPPGPTSQFPNLRFVGSITAAVDGLVNNKDLQDDIPIVRCGAPGGDAEITEYTMLHVLRHHRRLPSYAEAQSRSEWIKFDQPLAADRNVGFLGLGLVARPAAEAVRDLGFNVAAWTRTSKDIDGIEIFQGDDRLDEFLARSEIIVNFLPVTERTTDILNADLFAKLPNGASLINIGRGEHVVDGDLIAALNSGKLSAATLDVYRTEPLPVDDPLWTHPLITIMPHTSRRIRPGKIVPQFAEAMRCLRAGEALPQLVDRAVGY
jgi:glyoxylate/hydroxypyruvate reductase